MAPGVYLLAAAYNISVSLKKTRQNNLSIKDFFQNVKA